MAFQSSHARELQAEEKRILDKIQARARSLMAADPRLSMTVGLAQAIQQMPNAYRNYQAVRQELQALGIRTQLLPGQSRG